MQTPINMCTTKSFNFFLYIVICVWSLEKVSAQQGNESSSIVHLQGDLQVEGGTFSPISLNYSKESLTRFKTTDNFIYPYETITVYINGEANLCPSEIPRKKKRLLRSSKSWTERINHFKAAKDIPDHIKLRIGQTEFILSPTVSHLHKQITVPVKNGEGFGEDAKYTLEGYVNDDAFHSGGVKLQSYTKYDVNVHIDCRNRLKELSSFLLNSNNIPSRTNLESWLNRRLINQYGNEVINLILLAINTDACKLNPAEKIDALEFVQATFGHSNADLSRSLGENYFNNENYLKCQSELEGATKLMISSENGYLLKSVKYSLKLAETYEMLAFCHVLEDQGADEQALHKAFSIYNQAVKHYITGQRPDKVIDMRIKQLSLLKKINDIPSLERARAYVTEYIEEWEGNDPMNRVGLKDEILIRLDTAKIYELGIVEGNNIEFKNREDVIKFVNSSPFAKLINNTLLIQSEELILRNGLRIWIGQESKLDSLKIVSKHVIVGTNVKIQYQASDTPEIEGWANTTQTIDLTEVNPTLHKQYVNGRIGKTGIDADSNRFTILLIWGIEHLGGLTVSNPGAKGGKGGQGENGKIGYIHHPTNKPPVKVQGNGGIGGRGGKGGVGGTVLYDFYYSQNEHKNFVADVRGGKFGDLGKGGEKSAGCELCKTGDELSVENKVPLTSTISGPSGKVVSLGPANTTRSSFYQRNFSSNLITLQELLKEINQSNGS